MNWNAVVKEGRAVARQTALLLQDRGETYRAGASPTLFFLHGLYATAGEFRPLRTYCEESMGLATAAFNHPPGIGVEELANQATDWVNRKLVSGEYFLVGHSLGALAWSMAHESGALPKGCLGTLALAAPLMGARVPKLAPFCAGHDLKADSKVLTKLRKNLHQLPVYWVEAADDLLVEAWSAELMGPDADQSRLDVEWERWEKVGHNSILFDTRTQHLLTRLIRTKLSL